MTRTIHLRIDGMHCGHCVHAVREALGAVPGTEIQDVEIGTATVAVDDTVAGVGVLIDAVEDAGYQAQESAA